MPAANQKGELRSDDAAYPVDRVHTPVAKGPDDGRVEFLSVDLYRARRHADSQTSKESEPVRQRPLQWRVCGKF